MDEFIATYASDQLAHPVTYSLTTRTKSSLTFQAEYRPTAALVFTVLLFPIGLLLLFVKSKSTLVFRFTPRPDMGGTDVTIDGTAPDKVKVRLKKLGSQLPPPTGLPV